MSATPSPPATVERPYATALLEYAAGRDDVVCLTGDLSQSCEVDLFQEAYPDRFFNMGMAEQNMMGIAAGLAASGLTPFVHTFGVFATRRPFDQVSMSIAVAHAPVRIMGFLPGLTTPGGETHQAIDDVALMSAIPMMTVIDLGDATEISTVFPELERVDGPVYCRVMRGQVPVLFDTPFRLGAIRRLSVGSDLCLFSSSITTIEAAAAATVLRRAGVSVTHVHVSTLKPIDAEVVAEAVEGSKGVITVENHLVTGGLGSAVAQVMAETASSRPLVRLGLQDTYAGSGSQPYLFDRFGLSARHVLAAAERLLRVDLRASVESRTLLEGGDETRQEAL